MIRLSRVTRHPANIIFTYLVNTIFTYLVNTIFTYLVNTIFTYLGIPCSQHNRSVKVNTIFIYLVNIRLLVFYSISGEVLCIFTYLVNTIEQCR